MRIKTTFKILTGLLILLVLIGIGVWNSRAGQDWLVEKAASVAMQRPSPMREFDGLKVFMCGTSSPLPDPDRAQACVAILAGQSLFVVDTGAGSAQVATLGQLPFERLEAVFLTHFHSDHIAALPEFNLNSWVAGRPEPPSVYGPTGVTEVVEGLNAAYRLDSSYRVAHHGGELLSPGLGVMQPKLMEPEAELEFDGLTVASFHVNHDPIRPAVGYRFDYKGRSVVISGDATITPTLVEAATGADVLLQDTLSLPIIQALERATAGTRMENILHDIQDYHAHASDLAALQEQSDIRQLVLYHLVPPPQNQLFAKIFERELPDGAIISVDGMMIELPSGSESINVINAH